MFSIARQTKYIVKQSKSLMVLKSVLGHQNKCGFMNMVKMGKLANLNTVQLMNQRYLTNNFVRYCSTHEAVKSDMSSVVKQFESFSQFPDVLEITQIMEQVISTTMTPEEFKSYQPFIEEVATVAKKNIDQISNGSQTLAFVRFFLEKGETDQQVWGDLNTTFIEIIPNASTEAILDVLDVLRHNGMITKDLGKAIADEFKNRITDMPLNQLVPAATII
jgi:hypothetical protein